jgi:NADH:ubiquinone oxidoreductase subunit F (NADH-binding)
MTDAVTTTWPPDAAVTAPDLPRLLPPAPLDLAGHIGVHGPLRYACAPRGLIEEVRAAGLTGRGGAGFPAAVKMTAVADGRGRAVVVGNGAEGEPASHKDRHLLWLAPHLVLDGLQLAAEAVGARRACLYVHRHDQLLRLLGDAIAARSAAGCDRITVERPRVFERGVGGAPTLVQNVETLAHVALIARFGAAWFREVGTAAEPGSMLVTAHRADGVSLVSEVPVGAPLAEVLGLGRQPAQAVLTGGYHGAWIPVAQAATLPLASAALRQAGASLGAGVLAALPPDRCGLAETARVARYLALESSGQCGPCFNGLPRIAAALDHLAGPRPDQRARADLERWAGLVTGRGACHHPDGSVRFIRSALRVFAAEAGLHERGRCTGTDPRPFLPLPAGRPASDADWS